MGRAATRGEPAEPNFWADAPRRLRRTTRPSISSQCGRESYWMRTCFRNIYSLGFLEHICWNRRFLGSKWVPESSCEGFFLKNCCRFQLVTSCKGASVQRLLCVKAFVCKSFCVLCVKTSLCESFFVWKPVCVKISLCVKASVCKNSLCKGFSV